MNLPSSKNWKTERLGDIADVKGGKRLPLGSDLVSIKTSHPYIRVTDIQEGKIKKDQLQFVPDEVFEKISRYIVDAKDIVISIVGSVGFVAYIDQDLHKASLTENCVRLTEYKLIIEPKFLFYYLISRLGQHDIQSKVVGSTQPKLPIYNIRDIEIPLPILEDQRSIAALLGSLDDKIELLRAENGTLESMAQAIFKEWFVDFRFPGATGVMVDSELGKIPKGWRVGKLGEVTEITSGKRPQEISEKQNTVFQYPLLGASSVMGYVKSYLFDQEVFVIGRVGTHGLIQRFTEKIWSSDNTLVLYSKYPEFLYQILRTINFEQLNKGAVQPLITQGDMKLLQIIIPNQKILEDLDSTLGSLTNKIKNNNKEIVALSRLRDNLLSQIFSN